MKTQLNLKLAFFPLAWFLFFVKPFIEINGEKHEKSWGSCSFDLDPGQYEIKIYFPYLGIDKCGLGQITCSLEEGETKTISYYMWPWALAKGEVNIS